MCRSELASAIEKCVPFYTDLLDIVCRALIPSAGRHFSWKHLFVLVKVHFGVPVVCRDDEPSLFRYGILKGHGSVTLAPLVVLLRHTGRVLGCKRRRNTIIYVVKHLVNGWTLSLSCLSRQVTKHKNRRTKYEELFFILWISMIYNEAFFFLYLYTPN